MVFFHLNEEKLARASRYIPVEELVNMGRTKKNRELNLLDWFKNSRGANVSFFLLLMLEKFP